MRVSNPFTDEKILGFPERIAEWHETGSTWPVVVDFDMTNACTHDCPMCCSAGLKEHAASYTYEQAIEILGQFYRGGTLAVSLGGGGDPMCNPHTAWVIRTLARWGMSVGLITNGAKMNDDELEIIARCCTWVRISIDAGDPKTYKLTHGDTANWETTLATIRRLADCTHRTATLGCAYLVGEETAEGMERGVLLARDLGADYLQFRPFNEKPLDVSEEIRRLSGKYSNCGFKVLAQWGKYDRMHDSHRGYSKCHAQHFCAVVSADRRMWPCCDLKGKGEPLGNLLSHSVAEVLASERRQESLEMDLSKCPLLCRGNGINETLQALFVNPAEHAAFL